MLSSIINFIDMKIKKHKINKKQKRTCSFCGDFFYRKYGQTGSTKFCSNECKKLFKNKMYREKYSRIYYHKKHKTTIEKCIICGNNFVKRRTNITCGDYQCIKKLKLKQTNEYRNEYRKKNLLLVKAKKREQDCLIDKFGRCAVPIFLKKKIALMHVANRLTNSVKNITPIDNKIAKIAIKHITEGRTYEAYL